MLPALRVLGLAALGIRGAAALAEFEDPATCSYQGSELSTSVHTSCCAWLNAIPEDAFASGESLAAYLQDDDSATGCSRNRYTFCLDGLAEVVISRGMLDMEAAMVRATVGGYCPLTDLTCCTDGEKHVDGSVCCSADCLMCGGASCAAYLGGSSQCCKSDIEASVVDCESVLDTACSCPINGRPTHAPTDSGVTRRTQEDVELVANDAGLVASAPDGLCANGLVHDVEAPCEDCDGDAVDQARVVQVCCDPACGSCGGVFCGMLSTASTQCCAQDIVLEKRACSSADETGCVLEASASWRI